MRRWNLCPIARPIESHNLLCSPWQLRVDRPLRVRTVVQSCTTGELGEEKKPWSRRRLIGLDHPVCSRDGGQPTDEPGARHPVASAASAATTPLTHSLRRRTVMMERGVA